MWERDTAGSAGLVLIAFVCLCVAQLSKKVESDALQRKIFSKMLCKPDAGELRGLLANLQKLIVK